MLKNLDEIAARISNGYDKKIASVFNFAVSRTTPVTPAAATGIAFGRAMRFEPLPSSLESGVTAYMPLEFSAMASAGYVLVLGEMIDFGSLNIATNVFTAGATMPTRTVFNTSKLLASPIIIESETGNNATPGTIVITYKDQDNNTAEATASFTITANGSISSGVMMKCASPDWGAVQITNAVRSGGTTPTGTLRFWGMVPICFCIPQTSALGAQIDLLNYGIIRRLAANTKLGAFSWNNNAASAFLGRVNFVGDN